MTGPDPQATSKSVATMILKMVLFMFVSPLYEVNSLTRVGVAKWYRRAAVC